MMLARRLLPGPKITLVVGVYSVGDGVEPARLAAAFEDGEQFVFAVKTAHGIVADIRGIFQFLRFHYLNRDSVPARKGERVFQVSPGQAGGIGDYSEHLAAKHLMRRPGEKSGIHAPGVSDEQAGLASEDLAQVLRLPIKHGCRVHDLHYPRKKFSVPSS